MPTLSNHTEVSVHCCHKRTRKRIRELYCQIQLLTYTFIHACENIRIYAHICIHILIHEYKQTYINTCIQINMLHTHIFAHVYIHKYFQSHIYVETDVRTCIYIGCYKHTQIHIYMRTYKHKHIDTYIHIICKYKL
jgi:hypothetical protein